MATHEFQTHERSTREHVLGALESAGIGLANRSDRSRFVLVAKVDDDSLSDRMASFHPNERAVRAAITSVPQGWWPDCVIDLETHLATAVRDAAVGDGSLGESYPFDEDHVVFA